MRKVHLAAFAETFRASLKDQQKAIEHRIKAFFENCENKTPALINGLKKDIQDIIFSENDLAERFLPDHEPGDLTKEYTAADYEWLDYARDFQHELKDDMFEFIDVSVGGEEKI